MKRLMKRSMKQRGMSAGDGNGGGCSLKSREMVNWHREIQGKKKTKNWGVEKNEGVKR